MIIRMDGEKITKDILRREYRKILGKDSVKYFAQEMLYRVFFV